MWTWKEFKSVWLLFPFLYVYSSWLICRKLQKLGESQVKYIIEIQVFILFLLFLVKTRVIPVFNIYKKQGCKEFKDGENGTFLRLNKKKKLEYCWTIVSPFVYLTSFPSVVQVFKPFYKRIPWILWFKKRFIECIP